MKRHLMQFFALALGLAFSMAPICAAHAQSVSHEGVEIREAQIPMPDGVRLAADLYMPADAKEGDKFPVILEYLPYRKDESRIWNYSLFSYFVERGYIIARVDIRGTGNSEGQLIEYEYSEQEQEDGEAVIDWLSRQPFSTGDIGMFGISWGGFNSIHLAMRKPPALKAIIATMATDDIYQDDVHFIDGIMHVDSYEFQMDVMNALPGAPAFEVNEEFFKNRFDTPPWFMIYKNQQRDGPFWDRASLNEDYSAIDIPVFLIGGWYDGYRDSIPRMLEHMDVPVKAIMGPWNHAYPNWASPPPNIEWRHEAVRWFDYWLEGKQTGIMDEPRFAVHMRDWHPPGTNLEMIPGEWRWEDQWPPRGAELLVLNLHADGRLGEDKAKKNAHQLNYTPTVGVEASGSVMWWGDWAPDQRSVDAWSLVYESEPLEEDVLILGFPRARLDVSTDAPIANWVVRLNDVAPDGRVTQVTGAGFNGAHRESASDPKPLKPGKTVSLDIEMHVTSWRFKKGHRIRLAVNNAQWPMFWPTPHQMTTTLYLGGKSSSRLELPVVSEADGPRPEFKQPAQDPVLPGYQLLESETNSGYGEISMVTRNQREQSTQVTATNSNLIEYPWGKIRFSEEIVHKAYDNEPHKTSVRSHLKRQVILKDREIVLEGIMDFRSDEENYYYDFTRLLHENEKLIREKSWQDVIPRDHN